MEAWLIGIVVVHLLLSAFALGIVASSRDAPWYEYLGALLGALFLAWFVGVLLGSRFDKGEVEAE